MMKNLPNRLDLAKKLSQDFVFERIKRIEETGVLEGPLVIEFDPTTLCDLACPGCISGDLLNNKLINFSGEHLIKITHEIIDIGTKAVVLIGGGEPLLPKNIGEVISLFGQNDVHIGITTNGTKIHKHLDVIGKYVNWTRVSVDAASNEMFQYLRPNQAGKSQFNLVIDNMKKLADIKKPENALGFSFLLRSEADGVATQETLRKGKHKNLISENIIEKSNINEIYEAACLAKSIGCDYFEIKPSYDIDEHSLIKHTSKNIDLISKELIKCKNIEDNNFKILISISLKHLLNEKSLAQPKSYNNCPVADLRTLITPSGVYVCPYKRGDEDYKIGDLRNNSLKEIWFSKERQEIMSKLNPKVHCRMHCIRNETNEKILNIINDNIEIEKINTYDRFI